MNFGPALFPLKKIVWPSIFSCEDFFFFRIHNESPCALEGSITRRVVRADYKHEAYAFAGTI